MLSCLGIGLVGLGVHGERYARHLLRDLPGARLAAVCRADAVAGAAWGREHGVRFFPGWSELAAHPEVDAVVVVTPPHLSAPVALAALAAGRPVLVEKPLAASLEAGRELVRAASRPGAILMVAHTLRFNATVRALARRAADIGRLVMMAFNQRLEPQGQPWLDEEASGGVLLNTGVHTFDLIRFLSGQEVVEVTCRTRRLATRTMPDAFVATLELSGGVLVAVDGCRATGARSGRIELVGEGGQLVADHVHGTLARLGGREWSPLPVPPPVHTVCATLASFLVAARRQAEVAIDARAGLRALEVVFACRRSSRENRPVRLDELRQED